MKRLFVTLACLVLFSSARGAESPAFSPQLERQAFQDPADAAVPQLWRIAVDEERTSELRAHWEEEARGPDAWRYRAMLGRLAQLRWDIAAARAQLTKATELAPQEAGAWLLLGEFEAGEMTEAARPALEKAVELLAKGGLADGAVLSLASDHLRHGRVEEAMATFTRGLLLPSAESRRPLVAAAVGLAQRQGRLPEMLATLENAQATGVDSGTALALAYDFLGDRAMAISVFRQARKTHPADARLIEEARAILGTGGNSELLDLVRERVMAVPSPTGLGDLFVECLKSDAAQEAADLLQRHPRELALTAVRWRVEVPTIRRLDLDKNAKVALQQLSISWMATFARAELEIAELDYHTAAESLWALFMPRFDAKPLPAGAARHSEQAILGLIAHPDDDSGLLTAQRRLQQLSADFAQSHSISYASQDELRTLAEVRGRALIYLRLLARHLSAEPAFAERLAQATARFSAAERVYWYSTTETPELLLVALEEWAAEPGHSVKMDAFCRVQLARVKELPNAGALAARAAQLLTQLPAAGAPEGELALQGNGALAPADLERFLRMLRQRHRATFPELRDAGWPMSDAQIDAAVKVHPDVLQLSSLIINPFQAGPQGQPERRKVVVLKGDLDPARPDDPAHPLPATELWWRANRAFEAGRFAEALADFRTAVERSRAPVYPYLDGGHVDSGSIMSAVGNYDSDGARAAEAIVTALQCLTLAPPSSASSYESTYSSAFRTQVPVSRLAFFPRAMMRPPALGSRPFEERDLSAEVRQKVVLPPYSLFDLTKGESLWSLRGLLRDPRRWAAVQERIAGLALPAAELRPIRAALCYLQWWKGEFDAGEAGMRQLLAETGDDRYRLALAGMARQQGKLPEAVQLLGEMALPYPAFRRLVAVAQLRLSLQAGDGSAVRQLAGEIMGAPLESNTVRELVQSLGAAGYEEDALPFRQQLADSVRPATGPVELAQTLADAVASLNPAAISQTAHAILAGSVRTIERDPRISSLRRQAVESLSSGERQAYLADTTDQVAREPRSVEALLRQSEAVAKPGDATAIYQQILVLEPANLFVLHALMKTNFQGTPEQIGWFESLLRLEPRETVLSFGELMVQVYAKEQKIGQLAQQIGQVSFQLLPEDANTYSDGRFWEALVKALIGAKDNAGLALAVQKSIEVFGYPTPAIRQQLLAQIHRTRTCDPRLPSLPVLLVPSMIIGKETPFQRSRSAHELYPIVDLEAVRMALAAGQAPELRERAQAITATYFGARYIVQFLRLLQREPGVFPELLKQAAHPSPANPLSSWALPMAEELAAWPAGAETCMTLLYYLAAPDEQGETHYSASLAKVAATAGHLEFSELAIDDLLQKSTGKQAGPSISLLSDAFDLALKIRQPARIALCTAALAEQVRKSQRDTSDARDAALRFAGLSLDAHQREAAAALLDALDERAKAKAAEAHEPWAAKPESPEYPLRAELEVQRGAWVNVVPLAWVDPHASTAERASVAWDFGLDYPFQRTPIVQAETSADAAEDWEVELRFQPAGAGAEKRVRLSNVSFRGHWEGRLPSPTGQLGAVFTHGGKSWTGPLLPVVLGPNLVHGDPAANPAELPDALATDQPAVPMVGGPMLDEEYFSFPQGTPREPSVTVVGRAIKLKPEAEYELSGWLRPRREHALRIAVRYLDANRKPLGLSATAEAGGPLRWWHRSSVQLRRAPVSPLTGLGSSIPPDAVYAVPVVVSGMDSGDAAGFSLVMVPAGNP